VLSFFYNETATPGISTLSLHDALPIWARRDTRRGREKPGGTVAVPRGPPVSSTRRSDSFTGTQATPRRGTAACAKATTSGRRRRSEEHTSELQSLAYLVCRLLLEKKKR